MCKCVCIYTYIYIYIYIYTCVHQCMVGSVSTVVALLRKNSGGVHSCCSRHFLTACHKEAMCVLPIATRKPHLAFPYRLPALAV